MLVIKRPSARDCMLMSATPQRAGASPSSMWGSPQTVFGAARASSALLPSPEGRLAASRSVRIMQPFVHSSAARPVLISYPRTPRFNAPGLDLKLTREPGVWVRIAWRMLPLRIFGPIAGQLFLDFCTVYLLVQ